jgi:hypothetical protein
MKRLKWFEIIAVVAVAAFLIGTAVSSAFAQGGGPWGNWGRGMMSGYAPNATQPYTGTRGYGYGPGMMGGYAPNATQPYSGTFSYGMMGRGGMMGGGMMGGYYGGNVNPNAKPITLEQAEQSAAQYAQSLGANLKVAEVMQFDNGFYAEIVEKDTDIGAQEILIDPYTGAAFPEYGPNMMWNTKYGHMSGGLGGMMGMMRGWFGQPSGKMTVSPEQARQYAQAYLDQVQPGIKVGDDVTAFYGYYTLHTLKDGKVSGRLSVNGYSGQVWYHTWHGAFVTMSED